jgi:ribonuclease HI
MNKEKLSVLCYKDKENKEISVILKGTEVGNEKLYTINYSGNGRVEIKFFKDVLFGKILSDYSDEVDIDITCANMPLLSDLRSNGIKSRYYKTAGLKDKVKMDKIMELIKKDNVVINKSVQLTEEIINKEAELVENYSIVSVKSKPINKSDKKVLIIEQNNKNFIVETYAENSKILNTEKIKFNNKSDSYDYFKKLLEQLLKDKYKIEVNNKQIVDGLFNGVSEIIKDKGRKEFLEKKYSFNDILYLMKIENPERLGFFVYNAFILDMNDNSISNYKNIISDGNDESTIELLKKNFNSINGNHKSYNIKKIIYDGLEEDTEFNNKVKSETNRAFNFNEEQNDEVSIELLLNINKIFLENNVSTTKLNNSQKMLSNLISLNTPPERGTLKIYCDASVTDQNAKLKESTYGIVFRKPESDLISMTMSGKVKTNYSITTNDAEMWGIHCSLMQIEKMIKENRLSKIKKIEISCDNISAVKFYNGIFEGKTESEINKKHKKAFELFDKINKLIPLSISWVKGHSINVYNEECDRLAREAWKRFPTLQDFSKIIEIKSKINYLEHESFQILSKSNNFKFK